MSTIGKSRLRAVALSSVLAAAALLPELGIPVLAATTIDASPTPEVSVSTGWVIDTYRSTTGTIRVFGRSGQSITTPATAANTISAGVTSPDLKKAPASSGNSTGAVAALIALGVDPSAALRDFGGLDSLDGSTPASDQDLAAAAILTKANSRQVAQMGTGRQTLDAAIRSGHSARIPNAVTVSSTVPYDTQCVTVDAIHHLIQGYGCSTLYVVWANGGDWFFANKYKFSAQSTSTAIFPLRLKGVSWRLSFASTGGNSLYDWDPSANQTIGSCHTVTISSQGDPAHGSVGISLAVPICPDTFGPWGPLTSYQSGAQWTGNEEGTNFEAAIGTQELHNPATASSAHTSTYSVTYQCGTDC